LSKGKRTLLYELYILSLYIYQTFRKCTQYLVAANNFLSTDKKSYLFSLQVRTTNRDRGPYNEPSRATVGYQDFSILSPS